MTAIPLEVLVLESFLKSRLGPSQEILVIFIELAAGVSPGFKPGIGWMWDSSWIVRTNKFFSCPTRFAMLRNIAQDGIS
jgi:hypothetical protein